MRVTCEVPLTSGELCGLNALGRCAECERAFCLSHAVPGQFGSILALCVTCRADANVAMVDESAALNLQRKATLALIPQITAKLKAAGSPGLETKRVVTNVRRGLFGRRIEEFGTIGTGWPVGRHSWTIKQFTDGDNWFENWKDFETAVSPEGSLIVFESFNSRLINGFAGDPSQVLAGLTKIAVTHGVSL